MIGNNIKNDVSTFNSMYNISLVPRPFKRRRRKGLVHTAHACVGFSIATDRVTIVIVRGFCMV